MVLAAAIIGGAAVAGAGVSSSSGKKAGGGDSGNAMLAQIAQQLFGETEPLRQETISQALTALREGRADDPALQSMLSSISAGGDRQKAQLKTDLARQGLSDSSVGIAAGEDINRATSQLMVNAQNTELQRLLDVGRTVGFGQTPATAVSAASTLSQVQGRQALATQQAIGGTGGAIGQAIAALLSKQTLASTPSSSYAIGTTSDPLVSGSGLDQGIY